MYEDDDPRQVELFKTFKVSRLTLNFNIMYEDDPKHVALFYK